jgi:RNA polymerase sigma factor (sigma-70 family)
MFEWRTSVASTDEELCKKVSGCSQEAFEVLYHRHAKAAQKSVYRIIWWCRATADEVELDAFHNAWRVLKLGTIPAQFGSWLTVVARNAAIDRVRKERNEPSPAPLDEDILTADDPSPDASRRIEEAEHERVVLSVLSMVRGKLEPFLRPVFDDWRDGWSPQETASRLNLSIDAVYQYRYLIKRAIRAEFPGLAAALRRRLR